MNTNTNYFAELAKINVNEHIERKGQFSYLSWPFAVAQLRQFDTKVRKDAAWKTAAEAYRGWKDVADDAITKADAAKAKLVELATHSRESGYGVAVTRYWKAGNVDYKKVPELQGVNLEQYRGKMREEVRVTVEK